jgi:hypothetical protein
MDTLFGERLFCPREIRINLSEDRQKLTRGSKEVWDFRVGSANLIYQNLPPSRGHLPFLALIDHPTNGRVNER